jgi:hypothetical protein
MLDKNIEKEKRRQRKVWNGFYERKTPTKKEKLLKIEKKFAKPLDKWE